MEAREYPRQAPLVAAGALGSICMLTNVHSPFDQRIFYKEAQALVRAGYRVVVAGPGPRRVVRGVGWGGGADGAHAAGRRTTHNKPRSIAAARARYRRRLLSLPRSRIIASGCSTQALWPAGRLRRARALSPGGLGQAVGTGADAGLFFCAVDAVERWMARHLTAVVGVVEEQGERFAHRPFAVVKNYPRLECFPPGNGDSGAHDLVHIGSLSEDRGGLFLLEIMRELAKTHPRARLLSLGRFHSSGLRDCFAGRIREWGLEDQVDHCEARVPYDELGALIGACRVGLIPGQVSVKNMASFVPTRLFEYLALVD